jgi:hypothetical protein
MVTEDTILAVLSGRKQFDGRQWRVYDSGGTELADSGGVLWKGVHGALLWNVNASLNTHHRRPSGVFLFGQLGRRDPRY